MTALVNGHTNGVANDYPTALYAHQRFSDIPSTIEIPIRGGEGEEAVDIDLDDLAEETDGLCTLLESELASKSLWITFTLAYVKQQMTDQAIEVLNRGLTSLSKQNLVKEKIGLLSLLCWLYLWKSRHAPRVVPDGQLVAEAKTKDFYLQAATGALNEASRVNPSFPPLFLARGVLSLLRASLQPPSKNPAPGVVEQSERVETLRQALKCFEDASRVSAGRNMMALMGKGRTFFSLGRYAESLECYQEVLMKMPDLQDPDPRIGIGCCYWQLSYREEARDAWERALEINPDSGVAHVLLGIYCLSESYNYSHKEPEFATLYRRAVAGYIQKAFSIDHEYALTCVIFGAYFLSRKSWAIVEGLSRRAIELTDVNAIASDSWFLLARKEHEQQPPNLQKAGDFYNKADNARGGGDRGFLPAKFGITQIQILNGDLDGAKFRLEKIIQHTKNVEAMVLLGSLYAQDVFANQFAAVKDDRSNLLKKAISLLEAARLAWKDPKKTAIPDSAVLYCLSRLYETDQPEKSLQCLQEAQQMAENELPETVKALYDDIEDEQLRADRLREHLTPQILNNIGCFLYHAENFEDAKESFQTALTACMKSSEQEEGFDTDALVTTISYNLARTYEAAGLLDEARAVYEGLLKRHEDYIDAQIRLALIELRQNPTVDGPKAMATLYEMDSSNLEVRSLYGWYLSRSKKRALNIAEDQEQRHYKHTLQLHDKHDQYSLSGMGNLYLIMAREMRRDTDQDKEKRRKTYEKAVEFYIKAIQLDPKNAYAAQGVAIAMAEDKKDFTTAIQLFSKIKETIKDASVFINLGHVYGELKQYSRAIESYETALAKERVIDPQVLACLGRVWLLKGKHEKSPKAMKSSLEYSQRALELAPQQIHFQFNIAFVQIQLAQLIYTLPEHQRTLAEVEAAAQGLDEAINSFGEIARAKNPPYPRHDIEQRANMGRNTMRRQLERAVQAQREYEDANREKLNRAREIREKEVQKREEERRRAEEESAERKRVLAEERQKLLEHSRKMAEQRAEEEARREEAEWTVDSEGERVKRKRRAKGTGKRRKKEGESGDDGISGDEEVAGGARRRRGRKSAAGSEGSGEEKKPKKKRKLARKSGANDKYKSSELVVDSDSEGEANGAGLAGTQAYSGAFDPDDDDEEVEPQNADTEMADIGDEDEDEDAAPRTRKKVSRRINDDDDEQDDGDEPDVDHEDDSPLPSEHPKTNGTAEGNVFADLEDDPMVDETVAAAGNADAAEY